MVCFFNKLNVILSFFNTFWTIINNFNYACFILKNVNIGSLSAWNSKVGRLVLCFCSRFFINECSKKSKSIRSKENKRCLLHFHTFLLVSLFTFNAIATTKISDAVVTDAYANQGQRPLYFICKRDVVRLGRDLALN